MATSTLATETSFLPLDCTWNTARCSTRWNPSVGCTSRSSSCFNRGVVWSTNSFSSLRRRVASAPQARRISRTFGVSMIASSRCSTVMNSWRASRAPWKASFRQISSSLLNTVSGLFHGAEQRMLVLAGVRHHLRHLGLRNLVSEHSADSLAPRVDFEHHPGRGRSIHAEDVLQNVHHELHWRVVVIEEDHLVQGWPLRLRPGLLYDQTMALLSMFLVHRAHAARAFYIG